MYSHFEKGFFCQIFNQRGLTRATFFVFDLTTGQEAEFMAWEIQWHRQMAATQIRIRTDLFVPTPIKADATREVVQKRPNTMRKGHTLQGGILV